MFRFLKTKTNVPTVPNLLGLKNSLKSYRQKKRLHCEYTTLAPWLKENNGVLNYSRVDKGQIVQIVNSLPNFAEMSPTISRCDLEVVPKILRP